MLFCIWLLLLSVTFLRLIHAVVYLSSSLHCITKYYSMCDDTRVHLSINLWVDICFVSSLWLLRAKAAINIQAKIYFGTYIFIFWGLTLRIGIAGYMFNCIRKCQTIFQSDYTTLQPAIPTIVYEVFYIPASIDVGNLFNFSHSGRCEMIPKFYFFLPRDMAEWKFWHILFACLFLRYIL